MSFLKKITKAKITRLENQLILKVFPMWAIMALYSLICLSVFIWVAFVYGWNAIVPLFFMVVIFAYSFGLVNWLIYKVHSYDLKITGKKMSSSILPAAPKFSNTILVAPFFIDFFVTTTAENITVLIENQGQKLGLFRLASAKDLPVIIDGFTELLDLELVDSYKLSNKELLSFKSKQKAIAPYSALQLMELNDNLTIRSIVKAKQTLEFDFKNKKLQNGQKSIPFTDIQKIIILHYKEQHQVAIVQKNGQKEIIFKNKTTEITAIRDAKRLKSILEQQQELSTIKVEIVN